MVDLLLAATSPLQGEGDELDFLVRFIAKYAWNFLDPTPLRTVDTFDTIMGNPFQPAGRLSLAELKYPLL